MLIIDDWFKNLSAIANYLELVEPRFCCILPAWPWLPWKKHRVKSSWELTIQRATQLLKQHLIRIAPTIGTYPVTMNK